MDQLKNRAFFVKTCENSCLRGRFDTPIYGKISSFSPIFNNGFFPVLFSRPVKTTGIFIRHKIYAGVARGNK
jgi:hypothetical protein